LWRATWLAKPAPASWTIDYRRLLNVYTSLADAGWLQARHRVVSYAEV
jgi:hypothetical protein